MLKTILQTIKKFFSFFIEKPSARADWRWVTNNPNYSASEPKRAESYDDSALIYIPYQMSYSSQPLKSVRSSDSKVKVDDSIHLSNCLAKAYYPDAQEIKPQKKGNKR
ncbi:MAG: hypothetical protein AB4041_18010 [Microcystaceae cyanobacterium]